MTDDGWRPLHEVSTRAWASGAIAAGRWATERLLAREDVPAAVRRQLRVHQLAYAQRLADLVPSTRVRQIRVRTPHRWATLNPSIAATATGYGMVVRSSNYVTDGLAYTVVTGDQAIRTTNYLLALDDDLNVVRAAFIRNEVLPPVVYPQVVGLEDCRIFRYCGGWYASANARAYNPAGVWQTLLTRIEDHAFRDLVLLSDATRAIDAKNWMPLVIADELYFIAWCRPTVVLKYTDRPRGVVEWARRAGPAIGRDFRGSSQAIRLGEAALFVVHEQLKDAVGRLFYLHRLVRMDDTFAITHVSPPFYFIDLTIEFCAGLAVRGDRAVLSFGYRDRAAYVATMRLDELLASLRPVRC